MGARLNLRSGSLNQRSTLWGYTGKIRGYKSSSPSQPLCLIPEKLQLTPECTFGSVEGIISLIEAKPELIFNFSDWVQTARAISCTYSRAEASNSHNWSSSTIAFRSIFSQSSAAIHRCTIGYELQNLKESRIRSQILRICIGQIEIWKNWVQFSPLHWNVFEAPWLKCNLASVEDF